MESVSFNCRFIIRGLVFLAAIALHGAAWGAPDMLMIQKFADDPSLKEWTAFEPATLKIEKGQLVFTKPQNDGGPQQSPCVERDVTAFDFSSYNGIEIALTNPTTASQEITLILRDGKGNDAHVSSTLQPQTTRTARVRFERGNKLVDWSDIRKLIITCPAPATTSVWQFEHIALFRDNAATTPHAAGDAALRQAERAVAEALPHMNELQRQATQAALKQWTERLKNPEELRGKLPAARVELMTLADDALRAKAAKDVEKLSDPTLLVWSVPAGRTFHPSEAMLQYHDPAEMISIHAAKGEYGESLIRLTNLADSPQDARVTLRPAEGTSPVPLSIRRNIPVMARDGSRIGDALAPLDASGVITLPAHETAELWIRADVKHTEWVAGPHHFIFEVRDLRRAGAPATTLPLEVTIFNFDLAAATPMRAHFWPEINSSRSWIVHGREKLARDNLADYGSNAMTLTETDVPWPTFTSDGKIQSIDFAKHDEVVGFHRQAKPAPMLIFWLVMEAGEEGANRKNWALRAGLTPGSDLWKTALSNWLRAWTEHLKQLGIAEKDYAFYVTDEPDREELDRTMLFAQIAKSVNPKLQIYVNGSRLYDDPEQNDRLLKLVDIWQPDESGQTEQLKTQLDDHKNIERWIYRCSMARRCYNVNAHDYYRLMAWRAMRDGVRGIAYWTYCASHPNEDPWDETKGEDSGAILVYPDSAGGLIMSVRWELVRMALDDARYVDLLWRANPNADGQQPNDVHALLNERMLEIIDNPDKPELVTRWRIDAGKLLSAGVR